MFRNLLDIIASPSEALASIRQKPTILVPLLVVLVSIASIQLGYFLNVDYDFMVDELVEQAMAVTNAPEDQLRAAYANTSPTTMAVSSAISTALFVLVITAIYAGWLSFVSKFSSDEFTYRHWFSLSVWTSIPTIFAALAAWVVILSSGNGMISMQEISPLSLSNLLGGADGRFATLLTSINLAQFWAFALLVLGYRQWTGKSWGVSAALTLAPYLLLYGIWAAVILI